MSDTENEKILKSIIQKEPKNYISPLKDELKQDLILFGDGVLGYFNEKAGRLILDIDFNTRRGLSGTAGTIKIAGVNKLKMPNTNKKMLSLNLYDGEMNKKELEAQDIKLDLLIAEKKNKKKKKILKDL